MIFQHVVENERLFNSPGAVDEFQILKTEGQSQLNEDLHTYQRLDDFGFRLFAQKLREDSNVVGQDPLTFESEKQFDSVVAITPFGRKFKPSTKLIERFGLKSTNPLYYFILNMIGLTKPKGIISLIVEPNFQFSRSRDARETRKEIQN